MKNLNNKGITLIALAITIIIMLILAGIILNTILGDNGIITKAQVAEDKTNKSQIEQQEQLKHLDNQIDLITRDINTKSEYKTDGTKTDTGDIYNGKKLYRKTLVLEKSDFIMINSELFGTNQYGYELENVENAFIEHDFTYYLDSRQNTQISLNYADGYTYAIAFISTIDDKKYIILNNNALWNTSANVMITIKYTEK